ncbi:MAG: D-alanine--D-alanine ligase [Candidatus Eisenbacteria bacterium]|nr:D-alanine--D-alanine ligase [Candidatus Eisenbacteria bacterium]
MREELLPPPSIEGLSDDEVTAAPWKTEYDVVVTLQELGHRVRPLGVYDDLRPIRQAIARYRPNIAFNLLEEFGGFAAFDQNVVSYLELMRLPYTGCNPRGLLIARDKALTKKLLAFHRIRVPDFAVFRRGRQIRRPRRLRFPLFVKSVSEDASLGISRASLVADEDSLAARVAFVHEHAGSDAIAEEFIDGRELYVGVLGNARLDVFPVWELLFERKREEMPLIATAHAKWNLKYQKKWGVTSRAAKDLTPEMTRRIHQRCRRIYRILNLSGYARMDFRLAPDGALYFLEANPNPQLAYGEDFAESAELRGIPYDRLLQRILNLGLRWHAQRGGQAT